MKTIAIILISVAIIYYVALLATLSKSKKLFRTMFITGLSGVSVLAIVNAFSSIISINVWTIGISASFGVPGIIAMLAAKFFF